MVDLHVKSAFGIYRIFIASILSAAEVYQYTNIWRGVV